MPTNRRIQKSQRVGSRRSKSEGRRPSRSPDFDLRPPTSDLEPPAIEILGARHNNLKNINVTIPLGTLTAITGPSGSGKSTLVDDILYAGVAASCTGRRSCPGKHDEIRGLEHINKVIRVDQQPLGNSPTSQPGDLHRRVRADPRSCFRQLPEAKLRGYTARRFSFNVPGGRCEACEGNGQRRIEMHFLPDVWVECETCRGKRYNPETLGVTFHGRSISDVLDMTCGDAVKLFDNIPKIRRILQTLCDVGLDYLTLGQAAPTLSGGEAQRVKLAAELSRPDTGRTLYLLDEPTTGLHFDDLAKLLEVLQRLVDLGNTVVVIEHNLDVIKYCDWVIDLGPEAGEGGGQVVAAGTPEEIVAAMSESRVRESKTSEAKPLATTPNSELANSALRSHTADALAPVLAAGPFVERKPYDPGAEPKRSAKAISTSTDVGQDGEDAVGGRRPRAGTRSDRVGRTGEPCRWDGRILDADRRSHSRAGRIRRDQLERAQRRRDLRRRRNPTAGSSTRSPARRWLLKLKFRVYRGTFKRDELQRADRAQDAQRTGRPADLRQRAAGESEERCAARGRRCEIRVHSLEEIDTPEFWSFLERGRRRLRQIHRARRQKPRGHDALEGARPEVALPPQGFSARQDRRPGARSCSKSCASCCTRRRAEGAVPLEQPAARALHGPAAARALGHDPHQEAARPAACT